MKHASKLRAATTMAALLLPVLAQAHPGHPGHSHGPGLGLAIGAGIAALLAAILYTARRVTAASRR